MKVSVKAAWTPIFLVLSNWIVTDKGAINTMGRKQKHPNHAADAKRLMNELLDEVVDLWKSEKEPELKAIAEEIELSPAKLRKLLITAGERDKHTYYDSPISTSILRLRTEGMTVPEIQQIMGLSYTSIQGYLPHTKIVYNLDTMSAECERIRLYRSRKKAVEELRVHMGLPDDSVCLWKAVIAFEAYPFKTSGRGRREGVRFTYSITRTADQKDGGRHYEGEAVEGYGNELWVITDGEEKKKSITRSTVELGYKRAVEAGGIVTGPKKLNIPGAGSYLYAIFVRFGVIKKV